MANAARGTLGGGLFTEQEPIEHRIGRINKGLGVALQVVPDALINFDGIFLHAWILCVTLFRFLRNYTKGLLVIQANFLP
jgi:hypothetical protein